MSGPYADTALNYWAQGWQGVIPLPVADKWPPPTGFTGAAAVMPSYADVFTWCEGDEGRGNIGIRLPRDVLGIDVDAYAGKVGAGTLARLFAEWGPLPQTWRLSSRTDGISGIYLYRVPDDMKWPGEAGPHIELIQYRHRYAVAWPSVHPNGAVYQWWQGAAVAEKLPAPTDLPELPEAWIRHLTRGQLAVDVDKISADDEVIDAWLDAHMGSACSEVGHSLIRISERFGQQHSRHETMARGVMHLVHLGAEGHSGVATALAITRDAFLAAVSGDDGRSASSAEGEYARALAGAVGLALADPPLPGAGDPCLSPLGVPAGADLALSGSVGLADGLDGATRHDQPSPGESTPQAGTGLSGDGSSLTPVPAARSSPQASTQEVTDTNEYDPILDGYVKIEILRQRSRRIARELLADEESLKTFEGIVTVNLRESLLTPPSEVPFVVKEILPQNSNVVLAAQFKTGKTTLMLNLARSLVDDVDALNYYPVNPIAGNVCIFNYEVLEGMWREWARSQNIVNTDRIFHVALRGRSIPLTVPHVADRVVELLAKHEVHTWIIDPFARALGADENSNEDVSRWLDAFDSIKLRAGVNLGIVVTHTGRGEATAERSRGASRIDDWPDVRWLLTSDDDGGRWFRGTGRDVETPERKLEFDPLTRHLWIKDDAVRPPRVSTRNRVTDGELMEVIVQTVMETPGMGKRAVIAAVRQICPARTTRLIDLTRRMEQQNIIAIVDRGDGSQSLYLPSMKEALEAAK